MSLKAPYKLIPDSYAIDNGNAVPVFFEKKKFNGTNKLAFGWLDAIVVNSGTFPIILQCMSYYSFLKNVLA